MIYLMIFWNVVSLAALWYQRRRLKATQALAVRLQRFLNEKHEDWATDNEAWKRMYKNMQDRMAFVNLERKTVYAGPDALPFLFDVRPDVDEGNGWKVVRLSRWEDLPL